MSYLDIAALDATPVKSEPYDYLVVPNFIRPERFREVIADYPVVPGPGAHLAAELPVRGQFKALLDELDGPAFRQAVERKFALDLSSRPTLFTVRGECSPADGKIHTDSATKIVTVLLYMNDQWDKDGGRLRILRDGTDLENFAEEISPEGGNLLIFRRSEKSWHGHAPFRGPRRVIQMNWVTDRHLRKQERKARGPFAALTKLNPFRKRKGRERALDGVRHERVGRQEDASGAKNAPADFASR